MKLKPLNTSGIVTGFLGGAALTLCGLVFAVDPVAPEERWIGMVFVAVGAVIVTVCWRAFSRAVKRGRTRGGG